MLFSSNTFLFCFLPILLIVYFCFSKTRYAKNLVLTFFSLGFYAWGEPYFIFLILLSTFINYVCGYYIYKMRNNKVKTKFILIITIIFNIGILFIFKYLGFVLNNINLLFNTKVYIPAIKLPIGISFFTFQAMSYVIDIYRGNVKAEKNPIYVILYISFFPQLIAGPIVRYIDIAEQIKDREESFTKFYDGCGRLIIGLSKKVLLANSLAILADKAFAMDNLSISLSWLGALAYSLQLYFDFSGYSDMAIGLSSMFGFSLYENFNYPYISKSITEFWRRWHISLGQWFKDYLYIPLGGSRVNSKMHLYFNLFIVWFCTGLWHGARWTFVLWGIWYFILLCFEKTVGLGKKNSSFLLNAILHCYTMLFVILGWVIFRSEGISNLLQYFNTMFGISKVDFINDNTILLFNENYIILIISIIASTPIYKIIGKKLCQRNIFSNYILPVCYFVLFLFSVASILKGNYNPFIYFNF